MLLALTALALGGCLGNQLCYEAMRSQKESACRSVRWCYLVPLPCASPPSTPEAPPVERKT